MTAYRLPMFPLGGVLFPEVFLPLRVFEPRYRRLVADVLTGAEGSGLRPGTGDGGEFGVVLIERGSEVGGGDVRFDVATVARIVQAVPQDDGGWLLGTIGTRRVRIERWLDDDPYPVAMVVDLLDEERPGDAWGSSLEGIITLLRRVLALRSEMNLPGAPATVELAEEPAVRAWQACAVAPVGPVDDLRLLRCGSMTERLTVLRELLDDEAMVLAHRLGDG